MIHREKLRNYSVRLFLYEIALVDILKWGEETSLELKSDVRDSLLIIFGFNYEWIAGLALRISQKACHNYSLLHYAELLGFHWDSSLPNKPGKEK